MSKSRPENRHKTPTLHLPPSSYDSAKPRFGNMGGESPRLAFSFRYASHKTYGIKHCSAHQHVSFYDKLRILSELERSSIASSPRETNGFELLPCRQLRCAMPDALSDVKEVAVFRFGSGNHKGRIIGSFDRDLFYVLFIDHDFTLYAH